MEKIIHRCIACQGTKRIIGVVGGFQKCETCDGLGYIEEADIANFDSKEDVSCQDRKNIGFVHEASSVKFKPRRGRPPKYSK